jgi:hypothetical protein
MLHCIRHRLVPPEQRFATRFNVKAVSFRCQTRKFLVLRAARYTQTFYQEGKLAASAYPVPFDAIIMFPLCVE